MENDQNPLRLWTIEELSKNWQVKVSWIYQNIKSIPHLKFGKHVRFEPEKLMEFVKEQGGIHIKK